MSHKRFNQFNQYLQENPDDAVDINETLGSATAASGGVFGRWFSEDDGSATVSTTSATDTELLRIPIQKDIGGLFRIFASYRFWIDNTSTDARFRVVRDPDGAAEVLDEIIMGRLSSSNVTGSPISQLFYRTAVASGSDELAIMIARNNGSGTVYVYKYSLEWWRAI